MFHGWPFPSQMTAVPYSQLPLPKMLKSFLILTPHIQSISKSCWLYLKTHAYYDNFSPPPLLPPQSLTKITVIAKMVSLLHSSPLQPIVNPAAKVVLSKPMADHIVHLKNLKQLPISLKVHLITIATMVTQAGFLLSPHLISLLSSLLSLLQPHCSVCCYQTHSACFYSWAFTMAVFSVRNTFPHICTAHHFLTS